jgi:uncharacterized membrane protein YsdA (DUF1294 family)
MIYVLFAYLAMVGLMSPVAFAAYGWDKRRARQEGRRVSEKTLHLLALFGGWPGALAGQKTFRHKTQKVSFQIVFWLTGILQIVALSGIVYVWLR